MSLNKSNIFLDIITEYRDSGAKKASQSLSGIDALAKKVTKTLGGLFAAQKIAAFGKSSVDAFMAQEKATQQLNNAFKNLGLEIQSLSAERTIRNFMKMYGVQDELLIPAMTTLTRVTKNAATAQDILQTALDVSAGTGKDLTEVTAALAKAYGGNNTALTRLGAGLTKADLAGKSFAQIQGQLNKLFAGSAAAAADTYAGKIARLKVGFDEMKQSIGEGITNAFAGLVGSNGSIDQAINKLNQFGLAWQTVITNLSLGKFGIGKVFDFIQQRVAESLNLLVTGEAKTYQQLASDAYAEKLRANTKNLETYYKNLKNQNLVNQKFVQQDLANQKAITAEKNKQLALAKSKAILDKASAVLNIVSPVFDLQAIETYAALQQATNDSDKARLQLMQDISSLQRAIASNDSMLAAQIAKNVEQDVKNLSLIQGGLNNLKSPDNPLKTLLDDIAAAIAALNQLTKTFLLSPAAAFAAKVAVVPNYEQYASPWQFGGASADKVYGMVNPLNNQVTINVAGTVISEQQLANVLANQTASGIASNINRLNVNYGTP